MSKNDRPTVFRFKAVDGGGNIVNDRLTAANKVAALSELARRGLHPVEVKDTRPNQQFLRRARKKTNLSERVLILQQLAIMARAGIDQLDAVTTVERSVESEEARRGLSSISAALRRGEPFAAALRSAFPAYDRGTIALIQLGETSGKLGEVLSDAASDLAADEKVRKEISTALTYPGFLAAAGLLAVFFLFYQVVPRFAAMVGDTDSMTWVASTVMRTGVFVNQNIVLVLIGLAATLLAVISFLTSTRLKKSLYGVSRGLPIIGAFFAARERSRWARSMHLALKNGVTLLRATELASDAVPDGTFKRSSEDAARALRSGQTIDEIFRQAGTLSEVDLGLLRAGQKSGELAPIFGHIAQRYEDEVQETLKRTTALIEPLAITFVASLIGLIAFALMSALSGVYEQVG